MVAFSFQPTLFNCNITMIAIILDERIEKEINPLEQEHEKLVTFTSAISKVISGMIAQREHAFQHTGFSSEKQIKAIQSLKEDLKTLKRCLSLKRFQEHLTEYIIPNLEAIQPGEISAFHKAWTKRIESLKYISSIPKL